VDVEVRLLLILAAFAVPHSTVDQTWSCPVYREGAGYFTGVVGNVTTPSKAASFQFWPTPLAYDEPAVLPGVEVDTHPGKITWDPRGRCARTTARIPLVPRGLKLANVVTTHFVGSLSATCPAPTRIRFRARIVVTGGEPTRAQVIAVADRTSKPLLYAEWTPARVAVWAGPRCNT
jgi:hypothetical protein